MTLETSEQAMAKRKASNDDGVMSKRQRETANTFYSALSPDGWQ